jgi:hypothetical protein
MEICADSQSTPWQREFCTGLEQIATGEVGANLEKMSDGVLETHVSGIDSETSIPAILEMWSRGSFNVELLWWKQENRATRCFLMALYLCATTEPVAWVPFFDGYIERFNKTEQGQRKEEQKFVLEHRSAIAGLIGQSLKRKSAGEYNAKHKAYYEAVQELGLGKPLPKWCEVTAASH